MRCKIDDGTLEHLGQEGYTDRWKCRRCKVVWELVPRGDVDTDGKVVAKIMAEKLGEYKKLIGAKAKL